MVSKEEILNAVTEEPAFTKHIANKLGANWYIIYAKLNELALENKIERIQAGKFILWRKKNDSSRQDKEEGN